MEVLVRREEEEVGTNMAEPLVEPQVWETKKRGRRKECTAVWRCWGQTDRVWKDTKSLSVDVWKE